MPVIHIAWEQVRLDLATARGKARGQQRAWLDEFHDYLRKAIKMREPADSWTYCVVISRDRPGGGGPRTFRDFVIGERCYFLPYGKGWPRRPPNFLAFRCDGQVQRVHRVIQAEVIPNPQARWPDIPEDTIPSARMLSTLSGPNCPEPPFPTVRPTVPSVGGSYSITS